MHSTVAPELIEHVAQQIVRHRARHLDAFELGGHRRRLQQADPDRQIQLVVAVLENDDRRLGHRVEREPADAHENEFSGSWSDSHPRLESFCAERSRVVNPACALGSAARPADRSRDRADSSCGIPRRCRKTAGSDPSRCRRIPKSVLFSGFSQMSCLARCANLLAAPTRAASCSCCVRRRARSRSSCCSPRRCSRGGKSGRRGRNRSARTR